MANTSFKKEQFNSMTRAGKAALIENCIASISQKGSVTIDDDKYEDITSFVYWLLDNV